jgi:ABC-type sugar transport system ATPase subunit
MANVGLANIAKNFPEKTGDGVRAFHDINLEVRDREFMVLPKDRDAHLFDAAKA